MTSIRYFFVCFFCSSFLFTNAQTSGLKNENFSDINNDLPVSSSNISTNKSTENSLSNEEALAICDSKIKENPNSPKVYYQRAMIKKNMKDFQGTIRDLDRSIELDSTFVNAFLLRADSKMFTKDFSGAIYDYSKVLYYRPDHAQVWYNRGVAHYMSNHFESSVKDITKAIEINPINANYYTWRGQAKFNLEDYNGAILDYTNSININTSNFEIYLRRGMAYHNSLSFFKAIDDFTVYINYYQKLFLNDPSSEFKGKLINALLLRGRSFLSISRSYDACDDFFKVQDLGSKKADFYIKKHCDFY